MISVDRDSKEIRINDFSINDNKLFSFLEDKDPEDLDKWLEKILIIGAVGLEQISLVQNMDFIEKRFDDFLRDAKGSFETQQEIINKKLDLYFNEENKTSMISKFKKFIEENQAEFNSENQNSLLGKFKQSLIDEKNAMNDNFDKIFSLENTNSIMYKFQDVLKQNKESFDLSNPNSILSEFKKFLENESKNINDVLDNTFSEEKQDGVLGKFKAFLKDHENKFDFKNKESVFSKFADYMEGERKSMNNLFDENFSMEKTNSSFYKLQDYIKTTFDMESGKSPLNQFKILINDYFDSENGKLQKVMNDYIGKDNSKLQKLLDESFDLNNKNSSFSKLINEIKENSDLEESAIKEMLDPNKTDSPIFKLKNDIFKEVSVVSEKIKEVRDKELTDIRDAVIKQEEIQGLKSKSTQKGKEFEEVVFDIINEIAQHYEDIPEHTGDVSEKLGKVGDITCDIDGDIGKRFVIECKDDSSYKNNAKKLVVEMKKAIENRGAKFGIFVFPSSEQMPESFKPIKITNSYIVTTNEKENLYLSYRLARILLSKNTDSDSVDIELISKELERVQEEVRKIDTMQKETSKILNSGNYLRDHLNDLKSNIEKSILEIKGGMVNRN